MGKVPNTQTIQKVFTQMAAEGAHTAAMRFIFLSHAKLPKDAKRKHPCENRGLQTTLQRTDKNLLG